jgi:hypothetical protein
MKFEIDLKGDTITRLLEYKADMDRDKYYSIDYDLKDTYKPHNWDSVLKALLDIDNRYWELINGKNKKLKVVIRDDQ